MCYCGCCLLSVRLWKNEKTFAIRMPVDGGMSDWLDSSSEEENGVSGSQEDDATIQSGAVALGGQDFYAFANRMRSVGFREAAGTIAENLAQNSFNKGFEEAAAVSFVESQQEGREHARGVLSTKIEKEGKLNSTAFQAFLARLSCGHDGDSLLDQDSSDQQ